MLIWAAMLAVLTPEARRQVSCTFTEPDRRERSPCPLPP
jgi:hypothetical protein